MATITDTTTDANGNIIINVSSSADDAITLATAGTYSDKNIIFNVTTPQSTVQPDWNQNDETQPDYVKNRPFYTGDSVENIFVEESTVSFADAGYGYLGQIQSTFVPTVGETYKVSWDGIDYECTCIESNSTPMLGDINILFGESDPDGEPFLIGAFNGAELRIITLDTSASHMFSIVSRESVAPVVKISPKYLPISFKPLGGSYLTFSSTNNFTLSVENLSKNWDGTLEYFTSDGTWTVWDGAQALVANANDGEYALYLRGIGNTVITGSSSSSRTGWVLIGTDIKCIGNIENLLDYATVKSGKHPNMSSHCYCYMFEDCVNLTKAPDLPAETLTERCYFYMFSRCTSLTKAPELPAITLASHCYEKMFQGCTSLTQAPALPATMLAIQCYDGMFYGCTSLTQAPALPATTLANYCYDDMFYGCTSLTQVPILPATTLARECYNDMFASCTNLKLSSTKTDEYIQEYRIPSSENGVTATNALNGMFFSTGGTFTGTPSINTTYYLSSNNMIVRETDIATLNGYVESMINNAVPMLDTTLSIAGKSADAKATGDAIRVLSEEVANIPSGKDGTDGKSAYQYAKDGGYTGTEAEFAEKLAQEQLTGTTDELTPTQVYEAVSAGIPIKVQYTSSIYGVMSFTAFNIAETAGVIASQSIVMADGVYVLAELGGYIQSGQWFFNSTVLAEKEDIPTVPSSLPNPNALTFTGAVTGSYDGSAAKMVNIPSAVTDDHINELINAALNAIGVAEGVSY